jgi:hypothetical protein
VDPFRKDIWEITKFVKARPGLFFNLTYGDYHNWYTAAVSDERGAIFADSDENPVSAVRRLGARILRDSAAVGLK